MAKTLRLPGVPEKNQILLPPTGGGAGIKLQPKGRVRLGTGISRTAGSNADLKGIEPDDVACVEYSNGFRLWTRVDDLHREQARPRSRDAAPDANLWELDPRVRTSEPASRGAAAITIEALEFFGVDLKAKTARELCDKFELRQLGDHPPGLYQCRLEDEFQLTPVKGALPAKTPTILLLLHGTASSAQGAFGKLWNASNTEARATLASWKETYGEHVYAFEHRTLTQSPIENARDLLDLLPPNLEVHVVSHSRGGLVGELLTLGRRSASPNPFPPEILAKVFQKDRTLGDLLGLGRHDASAAYQHERQAFEALLKSVDAKAPRVTRFLRVACPARGTTLASGRLDRWLSVLQYLAGPTPLDDSVAFLLGVVKQRTDPRTLPGLEAQMPGSALLRLLNHPHVEVEADLSVISGNTDGESVWGRLKWLLADWFYSGDHDLVVNTGSMYGGARRKAGGARFFLDQGRSVNHFAYFENARTVTALRAGLARSDGDWAGFSPLEEAPEQEPAWRSAISRSAQQGPRPVAVVLPGTMGSQLKVADSRVWLNYWNLALGGMEKLSLGAKRVAPLDLIDDFYGDFLTFLAKSHQVVPFPYDWRLSIHDAAQALARELSDRVLPACERDHQPLRLLAHSMGGLVVRALIANHPEVWRRITRLAGSRFIMFGTPNHGSFEAVRWLTAQNPTLAKLSLLDITHDRDELVGIVNQLPGLLELLPPPNAQQDFHRVEFWRELKSTLDADWNVPPTEQLGAARPILANLKEDALDPQHVIYVAGCAPQTVAGYELTPATEEEEARLRFLSHDRGDGTVTWDSGVLPGIPTWYVADTPHDQLLAQESAFPAYLDLVQSGDTRRLPQSPPKTTRDASATDAEPLVAPVEVPDSTPGEQDGNVLGLGSVRPRRRTTKRSTQIIQVSITHGNLAYARYPVCVGHYAGDTIVNAEGALDGFLDGALSRRARLGLYPGPLGTHSVFLHRDPKARPGGAIIIGIGQVGELNPGALTQGVARAALDYALTVAEWPDDRFGGPGVVRSARLSCLLIGTGFGNMTTHDSIAAILRGIANANHLLVERGFADQVTLDHVEFIDLYLDLAIEAARALPTLLEEAGLAGQFEWRDPEVRTGPGGCRRVRFAEAPNWWNRLEITRDARLGLLRFTSLTDRARAEETQAAGQLEAADRFIAAACGQTGNNQEISRTLFEMLVPNRLKELAPRQLDTVLILDDVSAAYPWELLEDRAASQGRPLAVAAGMLRQLKTPTFRPHPLHTLTPTALVVGNPFIDPEDNPLQLADLPAAAREAEEVMSQLVEYGYTVTSEIESVADRIRMALHAADYRIVHLAGHGVHEFEIDLAPTATEPCRECDQTPPPKKRRITGMVLGGGDILTPGDLEQMRTVPELVFINCCHLGNTRSRVESTDPALGRFTALAANLGTQCIHMGAKAVVAAGWAVNDGAAQAFAREFYHHLLEGEPFGEAVRKARAAIHAQFPQSNTWGAYQCYGDPGFRLVDRHSAKTKPSPDYTSPIEVVTALDNLTSEFQMCAARDTPLAPEKIDGILRRIPRPVQDVWLERADLNAALGQAYAELNDYDRALAHLDRALHSENANLTVRVIENRANLAAKRAVRVALSPTPQPRKTARKSKPAKGDAPDTPAPTPRETILAAIRDLEGLSSLGRTAERLSLLGSAYKRLAWIETSPEETRKALLGMAQNYEQACKIFAAAGRASAYPLTNELTARSLLEWTAKKRDKALLSRSEKACAQAVERAEQQAREEPSFWNASVAPDCSLILRLVRRAFDSDGRDAIRDGYLQAMKRGASQRDRSAVLEHIDFLIAMADRYGQKPRAKDLRELRTQLS